jgi:hypothetical protein
MPPKTKRRPRQDARSRPPEEGAAPVSHPVDLDDDALLEIVRKRAPGYFWDLAHPEIGLARERRYGLEVATTGGSGFGVMAIIVGVARGRIGRAETVERLLTMMRFLRSALHPDDPRGCAPCHSAQWPSVNT